MSSRALRRLQQEPTVIKVVADDSEDEDSVVRSKPAKSHNPFAMLNDGEDSGEEADESESITLATANRVSPSAMKKKKKKKHKKKVTSETVDEDVDTAIQEVNQLLGEVEVQPAAAAAAVYKSLLSVDRRMLNANNEMRRIFGSRVVRGEERAKKSHKRVHLRTTALATPRDTWPKMDKPGLSMSLVDSKNGCQYFLFEHSTEYQKVQHKFWQATETFDPNAIAAVLQAHPYHIDSLLQLSEVCKMSEDIQMAAELIERALYCFECSFHTLFNITQANCRLSYSLAENRPFYIALFRHLNFVGRRGCHRTALEFCKLLLSLDPEGDPLCSLLMIDYHALRAGEYTFLVNLFRQWEATRNLTQLPNFAFSIPLAQFHSSKSKSDTESESDTGLQDALIMFPSLLISLLDKCGVTFDPRVMTHTFFCSADMSRDPPALQALLKLYIERSHSLWKEPEVLTWLEANCRAVVSRVDGGEPLVQDYTIKRRKRYLGTPRNIHRHVVMCEFDQVTATLPREMTEKAILTYDPLPPADSVAAYTKPARRPVVVGSEGENPFMLFLRSMVPTFNTLPAHMQQQMMPPVPAEEGEGGLAGNPGRALDLQATVQSLVRTLQEAIQYVPAEPEDEREWSSDSGD